MLIQIFLAIFIAFAVLRAAYKFKSGTLGAKEFLFWLFFWLAAGTVILWPETTSFFARKLGIGRGVDAVIYASIAAIFYVIFRLFVRLGKIEHDITKIVRAIALREQDKDEKNQG